MKNIVVKDFKETKIDKRTGRDSDVTVDLNKTEEQILESMHPKTRYNIKIANRHGVEIKEQTDDKGFEIYLKFELVTHV